MSPAPGRFPTGVPVFMTPLRHVLPQVRFKPMPRAVGRFNSPPIPPAPFPPSPGRKGGASFRLWSPAAGQPGAVEICCWLGRNSRVQFRAPDTRLVVSGEVRICVVLRRWRAAVSRASSPSAEDGADGMSIPSTRSGRWGAACGGIKEEAAGRGTAAARSAASARSGDPASRSCIPVVLVDRSGNRQSHTPARNTEEPQ